MTTGGGKPAPSIKIREGFTMTLERTFANEIKKVANGDGGREYKFAFVKELQEISAALANRYEFDNCVKAYGRAKVALCVATTIIKNAYRNEATQLAWARAVAALWTNKAGERSELAATINIHPSILADNSSSLRRLTVEQ